MKEGINLLIEQKSEILIEYIDKILASEEEYNGKIRISASLLDGCTFDISIPNKKIKGQIKTNISKQYIDILNGQILKSLIDNYMESETMGIIKYSQDRSSAYNADASDINIISSNGNKIGIDFACQSDNFFKQVENYNAILDEYLEKQLVQPSKTR